MTDRTSLLTLPNGTFTIPDTVFKLDEDTDPIPNPSDGLVWGFTSRTPWHQMTATGQVGSEIGFSTYKVECQGIKSDGVRCGQRYDWTIEEPKPTTEESENDHHETLKAVAGAVKSCDGCGSTMVIPSPTFIPGSAHRITQSLIAGLEPSERVAATVGTTDAEALRALIQSGFMKSLAGPTGVVARHFIHLIPWSPASDGDYWSLGDIQSSIMKVSAANDSEAATTYLMARAAKSRISDGVKRTWGELYRKHGPEALGFEPLGKYERVEVKTKGTATRHRAGDARMEKEDMGDEDVPTYAPPANYDRSVSREVRIGTETYTWRVDYNDSAEEVVKAIAGFCISPKDGSSYLIANPEFVPKLADLQADRWVSQDVDKRVLRANPSWDELVKSKCQNPSVPVPRGTLTSLPLDIWQSKNGDQLPSYLNNDIRITIRDPSNESYQLFAFPHEVSEEAVRTYRRPVTGLQQAISSLPGLAISHKPASTPASTLTLARRSTGGMSATSGPVSMEWEDFDDVSDEEKEGQQVWELPGDLPTDLITKPWIMRDGNPHYEMAG